MEIKAMELEIKRARKAKIKQTLCELNRKVEYYHELLAKVRESQRLFIAEHNCLDREIFEATHDIVVTSKRKTYQSHNVCMFGGKPRQQMILKDNYRKLTPDEQQTLLTSLLEIQATQAEKRSVKNSD